MSPNIIGHLLLAEYVKEELRQAIYYHLSRGDILSAIRLFPLIRTCNHPDFLAGNLIPDLSTDKKRSHFRVDASMQGFVVPNLKAVRNIFFRLKNPLLFGCYTHLWLDHHFIEGMLIPSFEWDVDKQEVRNPRNGMTWSKEVFFSQQGLYGAYTELNPILIENGLISLHTLQRLPEDLPETGIPVFDRRHHKTWRAELDGYLAENRSYTGDILAYDEFVQKLKYFADAFVQDVQTMKEPSFVHSYRIVSSIQRIISHRKYEYSRYFDLPDNWSFSSAEVEYIQYMTDAELYHVDLDPLKPTWMVPVGFTVDVYPDWASTTK